MSDEKKVEKQEFTGSADLVRQYYGLDTDRKWATSVQFFRNEEDAHVLLVFREGFPVTINPTDPDDVEGPTERMLSRNVTSVILPTKVARSLGAILTDHLGDNSKAAEPTDG